MSVEAQPASNPRVRPTPIRMEHIPALDGLRAIAVVTVMLFHAGVPGVPGGFFSVDLFFAVSGFLITQILLSHLKHRKPQRLGYFWLRRARRLVPALFIVVYAVILWRLTKPDSVAETWSSDIIAAAVYMTNWKEALGGRDYFAQFEEPSPLLHTWTLGIEEQFYIVFPFILIALVLVLAIRKRLPIALMFLAVVSACWMAYLAGAGATTARLYYGTDTRAQALLLGAALGAWAWRRNQSGHLLAAPPGSNWPRIAAYVTGFAIFAYVVMVVFVHEDFWFVFRGGFFISSIVAGAMILGSATNQNSTPARILRTPWLVQIGVMSYSIYLWHWPIFLIITQESTGLPAVTVLLLRFAITFGLGYLSFRLVEQVFRFGRFTTLATPKQWAILASGTVLLIAGALIPVHHSGPQIALPEWPTASTVPSRVFVGGDSIGLALMQYPPTEQYPDMTFSDHTVLGCGLMPGTVIISGQVQAQQPKDCDQWPKIWPERMKRNDPQVAIVNTGTWDLLDREVNGTVVKADSPAYDELARRSFEEAIEVAGASGKRPVYITNQPCYGANQKTQIPGLAEATNSSQRQLRYNAILESVVAKHSNAGVVDLRSALCPNGQFVDSIDGVELRTDGIHPTEQGAPLYWNTIMRRIAEGTQAKTEVE